MHWSSSPSPPGSRCRYWSTLHAEWRKLPLTDRRPARAHHHGAAIAGMVPWEIELATKLGIAVLGSTGSIGRQTLDVIERHRDRFTVVALAARSQIDVLTEQAARHQPEIIVAAGAPVIAGMQARPTP